MEDGNSSGSPCTHRCARTYESVNLAWLTAICMRKLAVSRNRTAPG